MATSTAAVAATLRYLRNTRAADDVILVGHSNGGVIALGLPAAAPDLVPFIRRIVTVDSPLGGVVRFQRWAGELHLNTDICPAMDELVERRITPVWPDYLVQLVSWEQTQGIDVRVVVNPSDLAVTTYQQQVAGVAVNYTIDVDDGSLIDHSAVLDTMAGVSQLAPLVVGN